MHCKEDDGAFRFLFASAWQRRLRSSPASKCPGTTTSGRELLLSLDRGLAIRGGSNDCELRFKNGNKRLEDSRVIIGHQYSSRRSFLLYSLLGRIHDFIQAIARQSKIQGKSGFGYWYK